MSDELQPPPAADIARLAVYGFSVGEEPEIEKRVTRWQSSKVYPLQAFLGASHAVFLPESNRYGFQNRLLRNLALGYPLIYGKPFQRNGTGVDFEINRYMQDLAKLLAVVNPGLAKPAEALADAIYLYDSPWNMRRNLNRPYVPGNVLEQQSATVVADLTDCYQVAVGITKQDFTEEQYTRMMSAWKYDLPADVLLEIGMGASIEVMQNFSRNR